jgi:hypothetical protein
MIPAERRRRLSRGRPDTQLLVVAELQPVSEVVAALPASAWHRITVAEESQALRIYEYVNVSVWFS